MTLLHRYIKVQNISSDQDPFSDLMAWISFLCAREFTVDLLASKHGLSNTEARARTKLIVPHVQVALKYLEQGVSGSADIAFLPLYYAILNLLKVYILAGPYHASLPANRWHGATYNGLEKDSHSIATEVVTIKKGGVLPLFYKTITGKPLTASALQIKIRDVLPFVSGVSLEYELASGQPSKLVAGHFSTKDLGSGNVHAFSLANIYKEAVPIRQLKLLRKFSTAKDPSLNEFIGRSVKSTPDIRSTINCNLLYGMHPNYIYTPASSKNLELFEEFPIAILFFYLSNICRYKPDFLDKLKESRYWPFLISCRTHSLHAFMRCFWSFINQESIFIHRD